MKLNDLQVKRLKATEKKQTFSDGGGLALVINPTDKGGTKYFVYNYRYNEKQQTLRIGKYPDISLSEARLKHQQARNDLANGISPAAKKQQAKQEQRAALLNTFERIARAWHAKQQERKNWKPNHADRVLRYFETDVFPLIGAMPINDIGKKEIKAVLDGITARGVSETAEKIRQWIGAVFVYAGLEELTERNPAALLQGYIQPSEPQHMPALPRELLSEFYERLILADCKQSNRICIMLIMLCFARNTEIRGGQWREIDFDRKQWIIPAERMKRPRKHIIPLSSWAIELLHELHTITGHSPYLFPSRTKDGYISENTAGKIINGMGYKGIATPHGFRTVASSYLNEQGFNPDAIERQLAHVEENRIRAAYNRTDYLEERAQFMQHYSDFLFSRYSEALAAIEAGQE